MKKNDVKKIVSKILTEANKKDNEPKKKKGNVILVTESQLERLVEEIGSNNQHKNKNK